MSAMPGRLVLLGHPVAHSLSPVFQNAALAAAGIPLRYEAMDVTRQELPDVFERLRRDRAAGNVTIPHKEAVAALCASLTPEAERVGAANAFMSRDGGMVGHNTDVQGLRAAVRTLIGDEPRDMTVGVVGAGGAAAAVLAAVESWPGCRAVVANRGQERLRTLVARFRAVARAGDAAEITREADIVVNATSLGLHEGDSLAIDPNRLRPQCAVLDLVYSRTETRLVRESRRRGLRAADGIVMLVAQGAAAFAWWFGRSPDPDVMWRSLGRPNPRPLPPTG
ncbi:MAG TPA: shikimate dehydrogenase [Gemmatimonadaceae bacterium]|nr:shikimate dehydrogenase [Gemmatimonadaceae bacterium]